MSMMTWIPLLVGASGFLIAGTFFAGTTFFGTSGSLKILVAINNITFLYVHSHFIWQVCKTL